MRSPAILMALILGLSACTSLDPTLDWTNEKLYQRANDAMKAAEWKTALDLLEKLEIRASGTPLVQQAQVDKAYVQYKQDDPLLAQLTIERFLRLHPVSPLVPYALYLKGLSTFNRGQGFMGQLLGQDPAERDQETSLESLAAFRELVERFPASPYVADARMRMIWTVGLLASNEIKVARYYLRRGAFLASVNRAQEAILRYPQAPATLDALHVLIEAYEKLNEPQLKSDIERVLALASIDPLQTPMPLMPAALPLPPHTIQTQTP